MRIHANISQALVYVGLIKQFAVRDLKLRYERSVLGFLWAVLNPLVMIGVYTFVFSVVLKQGIRHFPIFLIPVLLPWNFLVRCMLGVSPLVFQSGSLLNRAAFPAESLLFGGLISSFIDFCLEMTIYIGILLLMGAVFIPGLLIVPLMMIILLFFVSGVVLFFSVAYVYYRDTQYMTGILSTAWFFMTPIFYPAAAVPERFKLIYSLNPMTLIASCFRDPLYYWVMPSWTTIAISAFVSVDVFMLGWLFFDRYRSEFAEVLG